MSKKITLQSVFNFLTSAAGIVGVIKDKDLKWSSKRTAGLALIGLGYQKLSEGSFTDPYEFGGYVLVTLLGTILLGVTIFEKGPKKIG